MITSFSLSVSNYYPCTQAHCAKLSSEYWCNPVKLELN